MTVKQFRNTELTNVGFSIANKAALGKTQYTTTRAVSTDTDLSNYKSEDLKNLTKLPGEIDSGVITDYDMPGNNVSAIKINFNNAKFKDGYVVRAVAIYAKENGSSEEFLHSITVSDTPVNIPAVNGNIFAGFYLTVAIFSGNNKNINIRIADETTASIKYVDDIVAGLSSDIQKMIKTENEKVKNQIMEKVNVNNQFTLKWQGWLKEGQDLDKLPKVSGVWGFKNLKTNSLINYPESMPKNMTGWGYVAQTGTGWIKQELLNVIGNNEDRIAYRIYENKWHKWRLNVHFDDIKDVEDRIDGSVNQINYNLKDYMTKIQKNMTEKVDGNTYKEKIEDLQAQINNKPNLWDTLCFRDEPTNEYLSEITQTGLYPLNGRYYHDYPSNAHVVKGHMLVIGFYGMTTQIIISNRGRVLSRMMSSLGISNWTQLN